MGDKLTTSLTVLLTGFVVVFAVLLLLIGIIKLYGTIVYKIQTRNQAKKDQPQMPAAPSVETPLAVITAETDDDETDISELIAVISAAVYAMYPQQNVKIRSVRRSQHQTRAWRNAGLSDYIRPF